MEFRLLTILFRSRCCRPSRSDFISFLIQTVSILFTFLYVIACFSMSILSTATWVMIEQWSERYGPVWHFSTFSLPNTSVITRSKVLPDLCMVWSYSGFWDPVPQLFPGKFGPLDPHHNYWLVYWSLSQMMMLLYDDKTYTSNSINTSSNWPFLNGLDDEYGRWYMPIIVKSIYFPYCMFKSRQLPFPYAFYIEWWCNRLGLDHHLYGFFLLEVSIFNGSLLRSVVSSHV